MNRFSAFCQAFREAYSKRMKTPKIFISHSSNDEHYAKLVIDLLHSMGHYDWKNSVFCSSIPGNDIPVGERIPDYIKQQFYTHELYVLFLLSDNFYKSPVSLNEMGATWITGQQYRMILLPGFSFSDIKGVIDPSILSVDLNLEQDGIWNPLNKLRDDILKFLNIKASDHYEWESKRNQFIDAIQEKNKEQQKDFSQLNPLDIQIVKFVSSKGTEGATFLEIAQLNLQCSQQEVLDRLDYLVEEGVFLRRGDTRNSIWFFTVSSLSVTFLDEISRLNAKINSIPDYSKPSEWTP